MLIFALIVWIVSVIRPPLSRLRWVVPMTALAIAPVAGCKQSLATGQVSGKVSVGGAPVQFGTIAFITSAGRVAVGTIQNGVYRANSVPAESTTVTVQATELAAPVGHPTLGPAPMPDLVGKFVSVPERYASPKSSSLTYTVTAGEQTHDFLLEP